MKFLIEIDRERERAFCFDANWMPKVLRQLQLWSSSYNRGGRIYVRLFNVLVEKVSKRWTRCGNLDMRFHEQSMDGWVEDNEGQTYELNVGQNELKCILRFSHRRVSKYEVQYVAKKNSKLFSSVLLSPLNMGNGHMAPPWFFWLLLGLLIATLHCFWLLVYWAL